MNDPHEFVCGVRARRQQVGWSLTGLARRVGTSRQALTAIEAGRATPSTTVALRLARALDCRVEDLFSLRPTGLRVELAPGPDRSRVVVGRVGDRWVAHGLDPRSTAPADGLLEPGGTVRPLDEQAALERNVLVAGCAPVLGALAGHVGHTRDGRATWLHASSGTALDWLAAGLVHVAGMHLADRSEPGIHDDRVRDVLPGTPVEIVSLVGWRQGLAVAPDNPLGIEGPADLARPGLRIVRRQPNAGASQVLTRALDSVGADPVEMGPMLSSHVEAAQAIALGAVDVAVVIEPVAQAFGLPFFPLSEERFELAIRTGHLDHPGVQRLLEQLASAGFAREVAGMGAYDTGEMGSTRRLEAG
ncbi:MAG: substrate-binding domain-containing protein [Myxococcota bacterium]|nr:substrate-binding domain-containing protein [Myxococcota bacterium]